MSDKVELCVMVDAVLLADLEITLAEEREKCTVEGCTAHTLEHEIEVALTSSVQARLLYKAMNYGVKERV